MAIRCSDLARSPDGAIDSFNCHPKRHESEHMMDCVNCRDSLVVRTETSYSRCHVKEVANPRTNFSPTKPVFPFHCLFRSNSVQSRPSSSCGCLHCGPFVPAYATA